jgi:hypothetical protein
MFYTDAKKLNWTRKYRHQSGGYSVICYNQDYDKDGDEPDEDNVEPFAICEDCPLHDLLHKYYKKNKSSGILVVTQTEDNEDNEDDEDDASASTTSIAYTNNADIWK